MQLSDLNEMQKMFVDTISTICKKDYSPEQIKAWVSSIENRQRWTDKLTSQHFFIAELDNQIVGYASLESNDTIDFLYVHKDFQRKGIAERLYREIEKKSMKSQAKNLYAEVSITAKLFFEKMGFTIIATKSNHIKGVEILNYNMEKQLKFNDEI